MHDVGLGADGHGRPMVRARGMTFGELSAHIEKDGVRVERALSVGRNPPLAEYVPPRTREDGVVLEPALIRVLNEDAKGHAAPREPKDTIALAHEYGHHLRRTHGETSPDYARFVRVHGDPSKWPQFEPADRRRILEEEEGAWLHAAALLKDFGFADWPAFEADRDASLAEFRRKLALE